MLRSGILFAPKHFEWYEPVMNRLRRLRICTALLLLTTWVSGCGDATTDEVVDTGPREGYPSGATGIEEGMTIANLEFTNGDGTPFTLGDIHADGRNQLLLISTSAGWCTACIEEQPSLVALHDEYANSGLFVLVTVFETSEFEPSDADLAARWRTQYDLPFDVVADIDFLLDDYYDSALTPMNMFVDVNTMEIIKITTGWDQSLVDAIVQAKL